MVDGFPASLLPTEARGVAIHASAPVPPLLDAEIPLVARAIPKRRNEFARGRAAARTALEALGVAAGPILVGAHREPVWPAGIVGSITHCAALAWAAVARVGQVQALGIDVEPAVALPGDIRERVLSSAEGDALAAVAGTDTVGFGAKECIHKAIHPATGVWLDFHDVRLDPVPGESRLQARGTRPDLPGPVSEMLERLVIRWAVSNGLVYTSAWAPPVTARRQPP